MAQPWSLVRGAAALAWQAGALPIARLQYKLRSRQYCVIDVPRGYFLDGPAHSRTQTLIDT